MSGKVTYDPDLGVRICAELAEGKTLRAICAEPGMPARRTVHGWVLSHPDFKERYEQARLLWADQLFERLAERSEHATAVAEDAERRGLNPQAAVSALREELRAQMWVIARLNPAKYGDRHTAEITGAGGSPLIPAAANDPASLARSLVLLLGLQTSFPAAEPAALPAPAHDRVFDIATGRPVASRPKENGHDR